MQNIGTLYPQYDWYYIYHIYPLLDHFFPINHHPPKSLNPLLPLFKIYNSNSSNSYTGKTVQKLGFLNVPTINNDQVNF